MGEELTERREEVDERGSALGAEEGASAEEGDDDDYEDAEKERQCPRCGETMRKEIDFIEGLGYIWRYRCEVCDDE